MKKVFLNDSDVTPSKLEPNAHTKNKDAQIFNDLLPKTIPRINRIRSHPSMTQCRLRWNNSMTKLSNKKRHNFKEFSNSKSSLVPVWRNSCVQLSLLAPLFFHHFLTYTPSITLMDTYTTWTIEESETVNFTAETNRKVTLGNDHTALTNYLGITYESLQL